ncbi:MAG: hypothetical protein V3V35_00525 [Dehalococcoidia bacterium]
MAEIQGPIRGAGAPGAQVPAEGAGGSRYVFVHGRGGRFEEFSAVVDALGCHARAYAYSWASSRLVPWRDHAFGSASRQSLRACIGASVLRASEKLTEEVAVLPAEDVTLVGHSKGGAVVLQALADIAAGVPNPGVTTVVTLDAAISWAAQMGIRLETASKRVADALSKLPVLGFPAAKYSRWFLEYDRLDVGPLRASIGTIQDAGVRVINIRARSRWSSHIPGVVNVSYKDGGHRAVLDWRFLVKMLADTPRR